jgi:hypothetical protein
LIGVVVGAVVTVFEGVKEVGGSSMRVTDGVDTAVTDVGAAEVVWRATRGSVGGMVMAGSVGVAVVLGDAATEVGAAVEVGANGVELGAGAALLVTSGLTGASLLGSPCALSATMPANAARARVPIRSGRFWCRLAPCARFAL